MWQGPSCMHALYQMLLAPFEDILSTNNGTNSGKKINIYQQK